MKIRNDDYTFQDTIVLGEKHEQGCAANQAEPSDKYLNVDLSKIMHETPNSRSKKGQ